MQEAPSIQASGEMFWIQGLNGMKHFPLATIVMQPEGERKGGAGRAPDNKRAFLIRNFSA